MPKEIETKFKISSPDKLKKKLKKIDAKIIYKAYEKDTYYKNIPSGSSPTVVRLRSTGKDGVFTLKYRAKRKESKTYKIRDEFEINVQDTKAFDRLLRQLGFAVLFKKEKRRKIYKWKEGKICIDKLPFIGFYLEIEAPKKRIKEIANRLNLDMKDATSDTYMDIFRKYKKAQKKPKLKLLFKNNI